MLLRLMFEERMRDEYWREGSLLGVGVLLKIGILQACLLQGFLCGLGLANLGVPPMLGFRRHIDSLTRIVEWLGNLPDFPPSLKAGLPRETFHLVSHLGPSLLF